VGAGAAISAGAVGFWVAGLFFLAGLVMSSPYAGGRPAVSTFYANSSHNR
jgi:hypothetical protein